MKRNLFSIGLILVLATAAGCHRGAKGAKSAKGGDAAHLLAVTGSGKALERITADPSNDTEPALAPDGKTLLFMATGDDGESTIVGVDPTSGAGRTLYTSANAHSSDPAWMPDGTGVVFLTDAPGSASVVRTLTNTPNAAITVVVGGAIAPGAASPAVSPDGKRLALTTMVRGGANIAVVNMDGSRLTILGEGGTPAWSPDGKKLTFQRNVSGNPQLFVINADSGGSVVQVTNDKYACKTPRWSPDGKFIVFSTNRGWDTKQKGKASKDGTWNLYTVKPDGTNLTQITDGDGSAKDPFWGADGRIYFASDQGGNFDLWRLQPALEGLAPPPTESTPTAAR